MAKMADFKDSVWLKSFRGLIYEGFLPTLAFGEDRPIRDEDCVPHRKKALDVLLECHIELAEANNLDQSLSSSTVKNVFIPLLVLCGEHTQSSYWTTSESISTSYKIISCLKEVFQVDSTLGILLSSLGKMPSGQLVRWIIEELGPKLRGGEWKKHPGSRQSFVWILNQFTFPDMNTFVGEFLPFSLNFVDDWEVSNKIEGIRCLDHIISNVSPTELTWFGRTELIEDIFNKTMYVREEEMIDILLPVYVKFLKMTEIPMSRNPTNKITTKDKLMLTLLENMEMESQTSLKRCFGKHLKSVLEIQQSNTIRWLSRLVRVTATYLAVADIQNEECRICMLNNLVLIINICEHRIKPYVKDLLEAIFRLLFEVSSTDDNALTNLSVICLKKIREIAPIEFDCLCKRLDVVDINARFNIAVGNIIHN